MRSRNSPTIQPEGMTFGTYMNLCQAEGVKADHDDVMAIQRGEYRMPRRRR